MIFHVLYNTFALGILNMTPKVCSTVMKDEIRLGKERYRLLKSALTHVGNICTEICPTTLSGIQ